MTSNFGSFPSNKEIAWGGLDSSTLLYMQGLDPFINFPEKTKYKINPDNL